MPKPSGKPSRKLLLLVSVILFFVLIFAGYHSLRGNAGVLFSDFLHPYLAAERIAVDAVADQSLLLLNRHELAARLTELDRDNRLLAIRAAENRALREENRTLRQALSLPAPAGWKYRTALIVRRDPLLWNERFTLNLGSGDGVVSGAAVLGFSSDGTPGLVGVIDRVGNRSSEVETIFSPGLRLSTDFPTTGGNGILNTGDRHPASGKLPVGTLPANLRFTPGNRWRPPVSNAAFPAESESESWKRSRRSTPPSPARSTSPAPFGRPPIPATCISLSSHCETTSRRRSPAGHDVCF